MGAVEFWACPTPFHDFFFVTSAPVGTQTAVQQHLLVCAAVDAVDGGPAGTDHSWQVHDALCCTAARQPS